jgi:hypothetical protein
LTKNLSTTIQPFACSVFQLYLKQCCQMIYLQAQNPDLGKIWRALHRMENVVIFYDHVKYFTAIWCKYWPFGIVCSHLVYFSRFGTFGPRKIWQPWSEAENCRNNGIYLLGFAKYNALSLIVYLSQSATIRGSFFHTCTHQNDVSCPGVAAAWRSGHRIRLRNKKTRVRIPPGYKFLRET